MQPRNNLRKVFQIYLLSVSVLVGVILLGLKLGAVSQLDLDTVIQLRLPRVFLAMVVGMGLSIAGTALQALFSNPLCEPYTLGISSGSALGAVVGMSLGLDWMVSGVAVAAFFGALLFAAILWFISMRAQNGNTTLLLSGVMLGLLGNSLIAIWMTLSDSSGLQSTMNWLFGDLSRARLKGSIFSGIGISMLSLSIWMQSRSLDVLLMGEEDARTLGIEIAGIRRRVILLTSFLVGICVSSAGVIGFVGLIVPHFGRRWLGAMHFYLIPLCGILGAILLVAADLLSRVMVRPFELPVGIITSLVGAPVFVSILFKRRSLG